MNILEFIGSLEALPEHLSMYARDKTDLASRFGLAILPENIPDDVKRTRIPDRALDGFFAQRLLRDITISQESFADYAYTASAIFAAEQVALRSGLESRTLTQEYPYFIFHSMDPAIMRIAAVLEFVPLAMNWWAIAPETQLQKDCALRLLWLFNKRSEKKIPIEQSFQLFSFTDDRKSVHELRLATSKALQPATEGKIGLLTMHKFGNPLDYSTAFDRLRPRLSKLVTVLIYDKRSVVDVCCTMLTSAYSWRGIALKHLGYQNEFDREDYALLALQANFLD